MPARMPRPATISEGAAGAMTVPHGVTINPWDPSAFVVPAEGISAEAKMQKRPAAMAAKAATVHTIHERVPQ